MPVKPKPWRYESRRARQEREQSDFLTYAWSRMNDVIQKADPVVIRSEGYQGPIPEARERPRGTLPRARGQRGLLGYPEAVRAAGQRQREREQGGGGGGGGPFGFVREAAEAVGGGLRDVGEAAVSGARNLAETAEDLRRSVAGSLPGPGGPGGAQFLREHGREIGEAALSFETAASYIPGVSREDVRRGIRRAIPGNTVLDEAALFAARNLGPVDVALGVAGPAISTGLRAAGGAGRITGAAPRLLAGIAEPVASGNVVRRLGGEAAVGLGAGAGAEAVGRALPEDTPTGVRVAAQLGAGLFGAGLGGGLYRGVPGAAPIGRAQPTDLPPKPAREQLFGLPERVEPDGSVSRETLLDRVAAVPKSAVRTVMRRDPLIDPIWRARDNAARLGESQATLAAETVRAVTRNFKTDNAGRIVDLPGRPTLSTLAARLPQFEQFLTPKQIEALEKLRAIMEPFGQAVREEGIEIGSRHDIIEGGFYVPRGPAEPVKPVAAPTVGTGRRGGRRGFERPTVFESMEEGIEAGYKYESPESAVFNYVRDVQQRVTDEWTARRMKELTDDLGNPLGESMADRVDPELRGRVTALRTRIAGLNRTLTGQTTRGRAQLQEVERIDRLMQQLEGRGQRVAGERALLEDALEGNTDDLIVAADRELNAIGRMVGMTEQARAGAAQRAAATSTRALETQNRWLQLRSELDSLRADWERAKQRAAVMPRGTGAVGLPGLQGWSFPAAVADAANRKLSKEGAIRGAGTDPLKVFRAVNSLLRGLNASADFSYAGIQGLLGLASDPVSYGRALWVATQAWVDPDALAKYLESYDARAARTGRPTAAEHVAHGLRLGGAQTEYTIGARGTGALERVGRLPAIRESNRAFGYYTDALRLELADAQVQLARARGQQVTDKDLTDIANAANLMTGWAPNRFGGDWGDLALFAPRFFQSQLELVAKSVQDGSMTGEMARRSLLRFIGLGVTFVAAANEALGNENFDWKSFMKNGRINPNWLLIRTPFGVDVSIWGPWKTLLTGIASSVLEKDPSRFFRSKGSPLVSLSWDVITGKTYTGKDVTPETLLRRLGPFSVSEIGDESAAGTLIGLAGVSAPDITPNERLDQEAWQRYGVESFYDLTAVQQNIIKQERPELWEASVERKQENSQQWEAEKERLNGEQEVFDQAFLRGELSKREWLDERHRLEDERRVIQGFLFPDQGGEPKDVVGRYFAEWNRLEAQSGGLGMTDEAWDELEAWKAQLSPEDQKRLDDELGVGRTGLAQVYRATAPIRNAYWDLPKYISFTADEARDIDALMAEARALAKSKYGITNDGIMLQAISELQDKYPKRVVDGARRSVVGVLFEDSKRERYKREHPEVELFDSFSREPLTADEIALIEEWLAKPEVQERVAPRR